MRLFALLLVFMPGLLGAATAALVGTVRSQDFLGHRAPVPNAQLSAVPSGGGALVTATADALGNFLLAGLFEAQPPSFYTVTVTAPNLADFSISAITTTAGMNAALDLLMDPGVSLTGRVIDSFSGQPINGVLIEARQQGVNGGGAFAAKTVYTNSQGRYTLNHLTRGDWSVRAARFGWIEETVSGVDANAHHSRWWKNTGGSNFSEAGFIGEFLPVSALASGDVDGDGDQDIAVGLAGEPNRLYLNNGSGDFTLAWTASEFENTTVLILMDADGDGDLDWWESNEGGRLRVRQNSGAGSFTSMWRSGSDYNATGLALADMDGDGDQDFFVSLRDQKSRVYRNEGNGDFSMVWQVPLALPSVSAAFGDINGDSISDLVLGNAHVFNRTYLGDGSGGFTAAADVPFSNRNTQALGIADMNADGVLDIIEVNFQTTNLIQGQINIIHLGLGASYSSFALPGGSNMTFALAYADLEPDGDLDVALANRYGTPSQILVNNGSGVFSLWQAPDNRRTAAVLLADFDGDGDSDLFEGNYGRPLANFSLRPQGGIGGLLQNAAGQPLSGTSVVLDYSNFQSTQTLNTVTDASGEFLFDPVSPGTLTLSVSAPGLVPVRAQRNKVASESFWLTLTAKAASASFSGKVRASPDGEVLGQARIEAFSLEGDGAFAQAMSGKEEGYLLLLPAGSYLLKASKAGFAPSQAMTLALKVGQTLSEDLYLPRLEARKNLEKVLFFPNPCRLSTAVGGVCKFAGLKLNSTVEIFDVTGQLVRRIPPGLISGSTVNDGFSGKVTWDGSNEAGQRLAQGLYFYRVKGPQGEEVRGKLLLLK